MKKLLAMLLVLVMSISAVACGKDEAPKPTPTPTTAPTKDNETPTPTPTERAKLNVAVMKGPTALGMLQLMSEDEAGRSANDYNFTVAGTADEITASLIKGDIPVAAVPCNLAATLYNKTEGGISLLAVNTLGVLYILETGSSIQSVEDLKGKTIYSTGAGTTPEYTLRYLLTSAGIDPDKDVTIEYLSEATEVAARLASADNMIAMLPQPYVTTVLNSNEKARIALDVTKEWEARNDSTVVTGVIVANSEYLAKNEDTIKAFLAEYETSTKYAVEHVEEAATLSEHFDIFKAAIAKQAIPYCNIVCMTGDEMKAAAEAYLKVLFEANAKAVGGKLPATDFYYGATK